MGRSANSSGFSWHFLAQCLEALDPTSAERFLQLVDERLGPQAARSILRLGGLGAWVKSIKLSMF